MANPQHLGLLQQEIYNWNGWREQHPTIRPELSEANLSDADLSRANLSTANLIGTNLSRANLSTADLSDAELIEADLSRANLSGADLSGADLSGANLSEADLSEANLSEANLSGANFSYADLSGATVGWTQFDDVDLGAVKGLETIEHRAPSSIGIDTLYRSEGHISKIFLRRAGIPEVFLTYLPSLMNSDFEYYTCFISYSSKDQEFVDRLYADLKNKGVRCWLDKEDLKIGVKFRPLIDEAIRRHDKLLLVLSQHSVRSPWVETEVEKAFERERRSKKLVLFPIRLDEAVIRTRQAWAAVIRRQRHIGDFTRWKDHDAYQQGLTRLLRDLKSD